jgi:hypothetical protein
MGSNIFQGQQDGMWWDSAKNKGRKEAACSPITYTSAARSASVLYCRVVPSSNFCKVLSSSQNVGVGITCYWIEIKTDILSLLFLHV